MIRQPPRFTRTATRVPYTALFRSPRDPVASRLRLFGKADGRQMERRAYRGRVGRADARDRLRPLFRAGRRLGQRGDLRDWGRAWRSLRGQDRKSTRLNSQSLMRISYAVFCLNKKNLD